MPKVKSHVASRRRRKKVLKAAKGYWGARHRWYVTARQAVVRAGAYAYRDRRRKKRDFRNLWISRINAAARAEGMTYGRLIDGMKKCNIDLNRKTMADLAVRDPKAFSAVVSMVKSPAGEKAAIPAAS